jgi:hypothetical protein
VLSFSPGEVVCDAAVDILALMKPLIDVDSLFGISPDRESFRKF